MIALKSPFFPQAIGKGQRVKKPGWFAQKLTEVRERAGITKYALAKMTGLTTQTVINLESADSVPGWDTVQKLALALGVDCREFMDPSVTIPSKEEGGPGKPGRPKKEAPPEPPKKPRKGK
jgi:transcriptional regulator with XRE-family HTH domain